MDEKETVWVSFYDREQREVCQNEEERIASAVLRAGGSIGNAVEKSGMTWSEFDEFRKRCNQWENEHINEM